MLGLFTFVASNPAERPMLGLLNFHPFSAVDVPLVYLLTGIGFTVGLLYEYYISMKLVARKQKIIAQMRNQMEYQSEMAMLEVKDLRTEVLVLKDVASGKMAELFRQGDTDEATQTEGEHVMTHEQYEEMEENMVNIARQMMRIGSDLVKKEISLQMVKQARDKEVSTMSKRIKELTQVVHEQALRIAFWTDITHNVMNDMQEASNAVKAIGKAKLGADAATDTDGTVNPATVVDEPVSPTTDIEDPVNDTSAAAAGPVKE